MSTSGQMTGTDTPHRFHSETTLRNPIPDRSNSSNRCVAVMADKAENRKDSKSGRTARCRSPRRPPATTQSTNASETKRLSSFDMDEEIPLQKYKSKKKICRVYDSPMNATEIGQIIRTARKKAGLKQKELGTLLNVKQHHVSRWENGYHAPNAITLAAIAEKTGHKLAFLPLPDREAFLKELDPKIFELPPAVQTKAARALNSLIPHLARPLPTVPEPTEQNTPEAACPCSGRKKRQPE